MKYCATLYVETVIEDEIEADSEEEAEKLIIQRFLENISEDSFDELRVTLYPDI